MNLALWIAAGLLAAVLLVSSAKLFVPKEKMAGMGTASKWVEDFSPGALKTIGALELLGAGAGSGDMRWRNYETALATTAETACSG
jgi:hypothetical protein